MNNDTDLNSLCKNDDSYSSELMISIGSANKWYKNGVLHRSEGPAIETPEFKAWYKNGFIHRLFEPAVERSNGSKEWYQNGELHRLDGPAVEFADGDKQWWKNGLRHRLDGPAVVCASGEKVWYKNGKKFKNKDTFFRSLNKKEKEIALFSEDFLNG